MKNFINDYILQFKFWTIEAATANEFRDVTEEIKICQEVSKLSHDNILAFYGTWVDGKNLNLGFEFCVRGDLSEYLQSTRQQQTDIRMSTMTNYDVIKILTQIAQGLSFLHQRNIIHGNLRGKALKLYCHFYIGKLQSSLSLSFNNFEMMTF